MAELQLLLSCEHGGNRVPRRYAAAFEGALELLEGHRGYDAGALALARLAARRLGAPLHAATVTRLLVDLNRSPESRTLFSEFSRPLSCPERERVLRRYYRPYRHALVQEVERLRALGPVLHISFHSFTPEWHGRRRPVDIGLLYDPRRPLEKELCQQWQQALSGYFPALRVRRNAPYRGSADGVTTALRRFFPCEEYLGVEVEVSQRFPLAGGPRWRLLQRGVVDSLAALLPVAARG